MRPSNVDAWIVHSMFRSFIFSTLLALSGTEILTHVYFAFFFLLLLRCNTGVATLANDTLIAFTGDTGIWEDAYEVFNLIKDEGADLFVHLGDTDYDDSPLDFEYVLYDVFDENFPILQVIGNHDYLLWVDSWRGTGYQTYYSNRLQGFDDTSLACGGRVGVDQWCIFRGIHLSLSGLGSICDDDEAVADLELMLDESANLLPSGQPAWRVCAWHKNMEDLNVEEKEDEADYRAYEACREAGALIFNGHAHTYARTHVMSGVENKTVTDTSSPYSITNGESMVIVSGLGGLSIREKDEDKAAEPWWAASLGEQDDDVDNGVTFCRFAPGGDVTRASCYFKTVAGTIIDSWDVVTDVVVP